MSIPDTSREKIIEAMEYFDAYQRDTDEWQGWEEKRNHKFAIKCILSWRRDLITYT